MTFDNKTVKRSTKGVDQKDWDAWLPEIVGLLSWQRPHLSETEEWWVKTFIEPIGVTASQAYYDDFGNYVVVTDENSKTMFSAHTDTVHRHPKKGLEKIELQYQEVKILKNRNTLCKEDGEPLGADDAAGVWLLMKMIEKGVPGTYVFHRGEERGGKGSDWISRNRQDWLRRFDRAIAFDRRGTSDIITHQSVGRCCSDEFARDLAFMLGGDYTPCDRGVFTDTANYVDFIPECTNISCGYYDEHTDSETLDLDHLFSMVEPLVDANWEALPVKRVPGTLSSARDDYNNWWWSDDYYSQKDDSRKKKRSVLGFNLSHEPNWKNEEEVCAWVWENPEEAAAFLMDLVDQYREMLGLPDDPNLYL